MAYVEFRDVTFSYPGAEEPALSHISFTARPGQMTAIIGGTGAGKSTLVNLIPRFYDVDSGGVLVDGVDVREQTQEALRAKIGFVPQSAVLFSGTIAENIRYGKRGRHRRGGAPRGGHRPGQRVHQTRCREGSIPSIAQGGTNVSGGQKQRLSIARALVRKPEIYIFDDSFSALDFTTDANLRAALKAETADATVLIVAQRVSTIMDADQILVLDEGKLVGIGTHHELMESNEVYREIVLSQLSLRRSHDESGTSRRGGARPAGGPMGGPMGGGGPMGRPRHVRAEGQELPRHAVPAAGLLPARRSGCCRWSWRRRSSARSSPSSGRRSWAWRRPSCSMATYASSCCISLGPSIDFGYIGNIMLILLGLYVLSAIFSYIQQYLMAGVAQRVVYHLRREVEEKLGRLPLKFYDSRTHGEIMSRAVNDMDNISNTLQQSLTQLITSVVTIIGVIVMMLTISWLLTLVALVTLPLSIGVTTAHRQALAALLRQPAARPGRAERPRRGDVHRPPHRQGVWPRAAVGRRVQRHERRGSTTRAGGRSSSRA